MYQRILIPVDGSETSDRGLVEAIKLAKDQRAKLRIFHVVDEHGISINLGVGWYLGSVRDELLKNGQEIIRNAEDAARAEGVEAESLLIENVSSRVADMIIQQAQSWPAELIVMGTHGRRGVSRLFMGSDAEIVVRISPVPVLLVRGPVAGSEAAQGTSIEARKKSSRAKTIPSAYAP